MTSRRDEVRGELCGLHNFTAGYIDGRWWRHQYEPAGCTAPLRFVCANRPYTLTPPNGFIHDFASIPAVAWPVMGGPAGNGHDSQHGPAAILHDWAYEKQRWDQGVPFSRKTADQIFRCALDDLNVSEWRARAMYRILRVFGARHFRMHAEQNAQGAQSDYTVGGEE